MTPRFLLDTNICIYIARNSPPAVRARMARLKPGDAAISVITYGELAYGAAKSARAVEAQAHLAELIQQLPVLPMPEEAGQHYGDIRAALEMIGRPIGGNDLWIAAHARTLGMTLVSNNLREFQRVPGIKLQNWVE